MTQYVAFLRGMNLGRRRIKNDELRACFEVLGFAKVSPFLASGNVVFDASRGTSAEIATRIERGLLEALGYAVPTFLRTAEEVREIAALEVFSEQLAAAGGKVQVALLVEAPTAAVRSEILALGTDEDLLEIRGRELYWLPSGGILEATVDLATVESALGSMTVRTKRTLERLAAKFLGAGGNA